MNTAAPLSAPAAPAGLLHMRRTALGVRLLVAWAALALVALPAALLMSPDFLALVALRVPGLEHRTVDPTPATRSLAAAALLPVLLVSWFGLWQVWQLFGGYARGEVFTTAAALRLRRLALVLMSLCLVKPLTGALMSVALTFNSPPGQRLLAVGLSSDDYLTLLMGAVLLAIASVMREAVRLAAENAEFV
ncbi:DUF2975 domain-containing protein [Methylibium rhizosphaerae]|uniref:DUF2975 domain-containing protein n=1 Tax=Methylibium rhizosphaerae TaxID=2570323 RepID=UPI00112C960F|nr:DUF2975 domain-containing protein [Methylibium rhizosphaerae]